MAGEEIILTDDVLTEVMNLLEAEPSSGSEGGMVPDFTAPPRPDVPALHEQLAMLVSTGKAKDAIGVQLTHEQMKRLSDKDVEKYTKRYESYVGSKTTENLLNSFIFLATKAVGIKLKIKDINAYQKELRNDYIYKENSNLAGNLSLKFCRFLAAAKKDEVKSEEILQQSSTTAEKLLTF